jgi:hypothetical protein
MDDATDVVAARNARHRVIGRAAMRRAESQVIGCNYGATSYTTRSQADLIARACCAGTSSAASAADTGVRS